MVRLGSHDHPYSLASAVPQAIVNISLEVLALSHMRINLFAINSADPLSLVA